MKPNGPFDADNEPRARDASGGAVLDTLEPEETASAPHITRRQFLLGAGGVAAVGLAGYAAGIEPRELTLTRVELRLPRLPHAFDGFTILQLSDIHFHEFLEDPYLIRVVARINQLQPDLVIATGDFVSLNPLGRNRIQAARQAYPCADILNGLHAQRVAILGNHDAATNGPIVIDALQRRDIPVLQNRNMTVERGGERLWIAGVQDAIEGMPNIDDALRGIPAGACTIFLAHEPDFADRMAGRGIDLQLSGHSHGGQVRAPMIGPIVLPHMAHKYPMGHYTVGEFQLYTNRGLGETGVPFRFLCPPELTLFTLRPGRGQPTLTLGA